MNSHNDNSISNQKSFPALLIFTAIVMYWICFPGCGKNNDKSTASDSLQFKVDSLEKKAKELNRKVLSLEEKNKTDELSLSSEPSDSSALREAKAKLIGDPNNVMRITKILELKVVGRERKDNELIVQCRGHVAITQLYIDNSPPGHEEYKYRIYVRYKKFGGKWVIDDVSRESTKND